MSSNSALSIRSSSWQERLHDLVHDRARPLVGRRYYRLLVRRWRLVVLVLALFAVAGLYWAMTATPIYRSMAIIQINPDNPDLSAFEGDVPTYQGGRGSEEYLLTAATTLESRPVAERVVESLNLSEDARFSKMPSGGIGAGDSGAADPRQAQSSGADSGSMDDTVGIVLANLSTNTPRKTRVIEVSFKATDPQLAAQIVDETIAQFIAMDTEYRSSVATATTDFLRDQIEDLEKAIEDSGTELLDYVRANNASLTDGGQTTMTKLEDISRELTSVESELNALTLDYNAASRGTVEDFPVALATPTILDLEKRLYELERDDARLSARFGSNWPEVNEGRVEIEQVKRQLAAEKLEAIDSVKFQYLKALDRQRRIGVALDLQRQIVEQFNLDSLRYGIFERRAGAREDLHQQLLDRLVEAYAAIDVTSSNIRIVAPASDRLQPIYPRKLQGLILSLGLGLLVGLGLAVILESFDDRVMDELDVASLHMRMVGLIPSPGEDAAGVAVPLGLPSASTTLQSSSSALQSAEARYWEAFRTLRSSILLNPAREKIPHTVMITSAMPGEGKTTTVAHMAVVLSRTGARTLMIDLDLRNPALASRWLSDSDQGGGVSTLLASDDVDASSLVKPTGLENLFLLPAGAPTTDSIDLLNSGRLEAGIRSLRRMFDFVLIDTTSLHEVTDALTLARLADAVLVVVAGGQTSKTVVRDACDRLTNSGANILGIALNRADPS